MEGENIPSSSIQTPNSQYLHFLLIGIQADRTNYYHPLGFAYFPDGAHAEKDELEPSIVPPGSNSTCGETETCPAPKYYQDGVYLGDWMHPDPAVTSTGDFGLDHYEPKFFYPLGDWLGFGSFEVQLTFDVEDFSQDLFYFCHVSPSICRSI